MNRFMMIMFFVGAIAIGKGTPEGGNGKGNNGVGLGNGGPNGGGGNGGGGNGGGGNGGSGGNGGGGNGSGGGNGDGDDGGNGLGNLFGFNFGDLLLAKSLIGNNNNQRNRHRVRVSPPPAVLRTVYVHPGAVLFIAKCPIGSPLVGFGGFDLYCGPGPNRVDCPMNSQCIMGPNQEYFACCTI